MFTFVSSKLRSQSGVGLLEVLVGAAIIGITLPFAMSNFSQNIRALDSTRISAAIDQLDEELANNLGARMHDFLRASALAPVGSCKTGPSARLIAQSGASMTPSAYLMDRIKLASTSAVVVEQLNNLDLLHLNLVDSAKNGSSSFYSKYYSPTTTATTIVGQEARQQALQRCLINSQVSPPVPSSQTIYENQTNDFNNNVGIYFCAFMYPKTDSSFNTTTATNRTSLEQMRLMGEFLFVMRDPAGNKTPFQLNNPALTNPFDPTNTDVETCAGLRKNLTTKSGAPPTLTYGYSRLGTLYYTLYWVADDNAGQGGSYRSYSGTILVSDKAVTR